MRNAVQTHRITAAQFVIVLALAGIPRPVHLARLLRDGSSVEFSIVKGGLVLKLPEPQPEEVDRVIVLELEAAK